MKWRSGVFLLYLGAHQRDGEHGDIIAAGYLGNPGFLDLIDADNGLDRDKAAPYATKLSLELLFAWVNDYLGALIEHEVLDFDKAIQIALVNLLHKDFVNLALVQKRDFVDFRRISH